MNSRKALLTEEIASLPPAQLSETFATVWGSHPRMMLGCVWFGTPPREAAAQLWPGLRFHHTADYVMWGLLGRRDQFPISDERLQAMGSADLQRTAVALTQDWYPTLAPLTEQADPQECFFLTMRRAVPVEPWHTSAITLLGNAIHVMPANGSGANSALHDASRLARRLIAVASQHTPVQVALQDYESEMLRSALGAERGFPWSGRPWRGS